jgi:GDPmannose 4,6-dehydratase
MGLRRLKASPMKTALITGILGQDGTYLARFLAGHGYRVHGLIRLPYEREEPRIRRRFPAALLAQIQFHTGALEDPFSIAQVLKTSAPDEVYHLAGISDSRQSFLVPEETFHSIALGTLRLLEAARLQGKPMKFFLASSCEIFGVPQTAPQDEGTAMSPVTPYGVAKLAVNHLARIHRAQYGQFVSTGILYNHESPLRPANYLSRRVSQAVAAIKAGRLSTLTLGDLEAERDWSDARDFVRGFHLALQAELPDDYIFASGRTRKVAELVECAFLAAGLDYRKHVETRPAEIALSQVKAGLCGNPARAEKLLGWQREWSFEKMIHDMVQAELEDRPELDRAAP